MLEERGPSTGRRMKSCGQSQQEATWRTFLNPKSTAKITVKAQPIANEMKAYGIHILGIVEARWKEAGQTWLASGKTIEYSGHTGDHAVHSDSLRMGTSERKDHSG